MKFEDLSDVFTKEGVQRLKKGQLLRFSYEGSTNEFIITSLNKKSGKVIGTQVFTRHPDEVKITDDYGDVSSFEEFASGN